MRPVSNRAANLSTNTRYMSTRYSSTRYSSTRYASIRYAIALAVISFVALGTTLSPHIADAQPSEPEEEVPGTQPSDPTDPGDAADEKDVNDPDPNAVPNEQEGVAEVPTNIRLRQLEQRVQALKERAWRAKARIGMLKEAVLGGGIGARASINHENKMGNSYRLLKLVYALDGTQIFTRNDPTGKLHDEKTFDVLTGPIAPGSHTISVLAVYRGNGYGPIKYLNKYKFTVRSSHTFTAAEGKGTSIKVVAYEKGGISTPLEKRPAIDFKVSVVEGIKKEEK